MKSLTLPVFLVSAWFSAGPAFAADANTLDSAGIKSTIERVADWQLATPNETGLRNWVIAPLYDGLLATAIATGQPKYLGAVIRMGTQSGWEPGDGLYHADSHAVGHAWLRIYLLDPARKERLQPFKDRFDAILAKPATETLSFKRKPQTPGVTMTDRWTWCDALYMSPPTLALLAKATGDPRYLAFLDQEYRATYDSLFDPTENLFYRDERFLDQRTPNGKKIFWSRGNGWVFAGLPQVLDALPEDYLTRKFYTELFQKMAAAVLAAQQPDGLWTPSLQDPKQIAVGETSGSAFFVYGLAWGVRQKLLDRDTYWPAVERGWNALFTRIGPDGAVGFVQPIGESPGQLDAKSQQLYGTGGVLLAGSEILQALGAASKVSPVGLVEAAEALLAADRSPRAYARLVPERKDDLAWENDKVAFRVYGPALRESIEGSGIDAWAKQVPYPILDKWYADDLAGRQSYHKNHGEGYDGFKVGDSPGAGGLGLWQDGKIVAADVYDTAEILFTTPDVAAFRTRYTYPETGGKRLIENRVTRLRRGERFNEITSRFTIDTKDNPPADGLAVAVGLITQTPKGEIVLQPEDGLMAVWDTLDAGENFGIAAQVPSGCAMQKLRHAGEPPLDEALAILHTDSKGEITYRTGFGWTADPEIASREAWLRIVKRESPAPSLPGSK